MAFKPIEMTYKILIISIIFSFSCKSTSSIESGQHLSIFLEKLDCGSYQAKSNEKILGYVVESGIIEIENANGFVYSFEKSLQEKYSNYYKDFYRVYIFLSNSATEPILQVVMLSSNQAGLIPDWQCKEKDFDVYKTGERYPFLFDKKHPQFLVYDCLKKEFVSE
jgi:hypothetical protein